MRPDKRRQSAQGGARSFAQPLKLCKCTAAPPVCNNVYGPRKLCPFHGWVGAVDGAEKKTPKRGFAAPFEGRRDVYALETGPASTCMLAASGP